MKKIFISTIVLLISVLSLCSCNCKHQNHSEANCVTPSYCLQCNTTLGEALGHTEGKWIIDQEPTCTENGSKHQICSTCNETIKTETLTKLGHTEGKWITDKNPTCTENGSKHQVCSVCEVTIKTETLEKLGHKEVIDKAVAPTCIATGLTEGKHCSACNIVLQKQTIVNKSDHSSVNGICKVCNKVTNAQLALASYIIQNGIKMDSGNKYMIYKKSSSSSGFDATGYIVFDLDTSQFTFSMDGNNGSTNTFLTMTLKIGNSTQLVEMLAKVSGYQFYASGNIYTSTFDADSPYIYSFTCNSSTVSSSLKNLLKTSTASMLLFSEIMLYETNTGVTMEMLGFKNLS